MPKKTIDESEFLKAHALDEKVFITGMFYSGITIYNQQVRTLNLIYFLTKNKVLKDPTSERHIAIIGGGVSGLTAFLALSRLGYSVTLLEEKPMLLHLQHGCTIRQIHPNIALWPRGESSKPFTELPFANWTADDASHIEKSLIKEYNAERAKAGKRLNVIFNIDPKDTKVDVNNNKLTYSKNRRKAVIEYELLLLATGFGLERYVGKKEITKSYWRNEDFSQLRVKDQISNFFISGVGDGGVSDLFRLSLTGFDPSEIARAFEGIENKKGKLIDLLRSIESRAANLSQHNYLDDFENVFRTFETEITELVSDKKRHDVKDIVLNGNSKKLGTNYSKGKLLFINAWLLFVLQKLEYFSYHPGPFPDKCGKYIFADKLDDAYQIVVRHGTDKNLEFFKSLNVDFEATINNLQKLQGKKQYNDFSVVSRWELEHWSPRDNYNPKRFFVSPDLNKLCITYLKTLEGIVRNFASDNKIENFTFRMTLHRLIMYSKEYYFQQISEYVGDRLDSGFGRVFPMTEGLVALGMRSNMCFSLVKEDENEELFQYTELHARTLADDVKSFLVIPIPSKDKESVLCFYLDSTEIELVKQKEFRKLVYSSLVYFTEYLNSRNEESLELEVGVPKAANEKKLLVIKGLVNHNTELETYWAEGKLKMSSNKLINLYGT